MINENLAKIIDEKNGINKNVPLKTSFKNCVDQLSFSTHENNFDRFINLRPEIYITSLEGSDYIYGDLKKTESKFSIEIESLVTHKNYLFNSNHKTKIKSPYPNKAIFCAGQTINRNFKQGITFIPKDTEGVRLNSDEFKNIDKKYHRFKILDNAVEETEFNWRYNIFPRTSLSISKSSTIDDSNEEYSFQDFVNDKYVIFPYKITESWNLKFDEQETNDTKDIDNSYNVKITYILYVLRYSIHYLNKVLKNESDDILCEVASLGGRVLKNIYDNDNVSLLGKVYGDKSKTPILTYKEREMVRVPLFYDRPENYELINDKNDSHLKIEKPKVISMIPVLK